ncbi:hypothetical protein ACI2K4_09185 [Micromonospora sp. NPDC050397]|uniref:hypothetical protein n=1 Tax=Micromonospora sp. NPDC050397 TaxID=3364279 RepID=UPI0038501B97
MQKRLPVVLTMVGIALVVAGCSSTSDDPAEPQAPSGRYLTVASDRIAVEVFRSDILVRLERQEASVRATCMAERGFPQLAQVGQVAPERGLVELNVTAPGFATVSEADARRLGFGQDEPARAPRVMSYHAGFDRAFARCTEQAADRIGPRFTDLRGRAYDLMRDVNAEVRAESTSGADAEAYRMIAAPVLDCLDQAGFTHQGDERHLRAYGVGLPTGTWSGAGPPTPKEARGTVEVLPAVPSRTYTPTPGEVALAVAANRCARRSGYAEKYVEQALTSTRAVLTRHEVELAELAAAIDRLADRSRR